VRETLALGGERGEVVRGRRGGALTAKVVEEEMEVAGVRYSRRRRDMNPKRTYVLSLRVNIHRASQQDSEHLSYLIANRFRRSTDVVVPGDGVVVEDLVILPADLHPLRFVLQDPVLDFDAQALN
jgi:hypothetical protein